MKLIAILVSLFSFLLLINGVYNQIPFQVNIHSQLWGLNQLHFSEFKRKLKARIAPSIDKRILLTKQAPFSPAPSPSINGGFYDHPVKVILSCGKNEDSIYYSLDGSIPTKRSLRHKRPIHIAKTVTLRFRSFQKGYFPSETVTHTYFINDEFKIPVVSLVSDPVNLWNKYSGIYENPNKRGRKWERHAHLEYFKDKYRNPVRLPATVRIHGGWSRSKPKKSFRISYSLSAINNSDTKNSIFTQESHASERTIILRAGGSNVKYRLRDELFQSLYSEIGGLSSLFEPIMLFVNGKIWGIYNIRERINEEFLIKRFGNGEYELVSARYLLGSKEDRKRSIRLLESSNLSTQAEFDRIKEVIDIKNTTDYWLLNIYAGNMDWPHANLFMYRKQHQEDKRWRWISWDADCSFDLNGQGLNHNTLAWAIRNKLRHDLRYNNEMGLKDHEEMVKATRIIRNLLKNDFYKEYFILRFCDMLNCYLAPKRVADKLYQIIQLSANDLPHDWKRWNISEKEYWRNVDEIYDFIYRRPEIITRFFQKEFKLGKIFTIEIENDSPESGKIQINTVQADSKKWAGKYFEGLTISLLAKPTHGYKFVGWNNDANLRNSPKLSFKLDRDYIIGAKFERIFSE